MTWVFKYCTLASQRAQICERSRRVKITRIGLGSACTLYKQNCDTTGGSKHDKNIKKTRQNHRAEQKGQG